MNRATLPSRMDKPLHLCSIMKTAHVVTGGAMSHRLNRHADAGCGYVMTGETHQ
jgi:hypothetical protein